jgi:hypothetical protein
MTRLEAVTIICLLVLIAVILQTGHVHVVLVGDTASTYHPTQYQAQAIQRSLK